MKVRYPNELIIEYHGSFEETKYQVQIQKQIPQKSQLYFYLNEVYDPSIHPSSSDTLVDLAIIIYDNFAFCSQSLKKQLEKEKFICQVPVESIVKFRDPDQIKYIPRFHHTNDIFHERKSLKDKLMDNASAYYDSYEHYKKERLEEIQSICNNLESNEYVISTFNEPYIPLLQNFVASCEKNGIEIRDKMIAFPMDDASKVASINLGIQTYYQEGVYGKTTSIHKGYSDEYFVICMFMKNAIVQDLILLNKDFLFQDIDMVWLKNPIPDLKNKAISGCYDFQFMYDGGNPRYQPLYYNSGFMYVKNTDFTKQTWKVIFENYDKVLAYRSQQAPLNIIMSAYKERGLRTLLLDENEYLNGHLLSHDKRKIGNIKPETKVVHVSWTGDLSFKLKKLKENNLWYIN